jgi:predicted metal-dependent phosphoesterase TrpH
MLIDLHTHTYPASYDSYVSADDMIEWAKKTGLDGICLSEHDVLWDPSEVLELGKRHEFLVLPAIEVTTEHGHMLCYGITDYVKEYFKFENLAARLLLERGAVVAAHPFRRNMPWNLAKGEEYEAAIERASRIPAYAYCSGMEVINGKATVDENAFSARLCEYLEMKGTAGTDSHQLSDIGKCATEFERRIETVEDLINELKAGRFRAVSLLPKPAPIPPTAPSHTTSD